MRNPKHPEPLYRKPAMVPATAENLRAWFDDLRERMADPDPVGTLLTEWNEALRKFLAEHGVKVLKHSPGAAALTAGRLTIASVPGGHVCYRKSEVHPAVVEAIEVLQAIEAVQRATGERRVLAVFDLGAAVERTRATAAFARKVGGKQRQEANFRAKRYVAPLKADPLEIAAVLGTSQSNKDAARRLGVSLRTITSYRKKYAQV